MKKYLKILLQILKKANPLSMNDILHVLKEEKK